MPTNTPEPVETSIESNGNINKGGVTTLYPESFWKEHVEKYLASGYNKSQYCRQNNLAYHRFLHWCKKITKNYPVSFDGNSSFIPVKLKPTASAISDHCLCSLELSKGHRLLIHDESALQLLLTKLLQ